jgi:xylulokinase
MDRRKLANGGQPVTRGRDDHRPRELGDEPIDAANTVSFRVHKHFAMMIHNGMCVGPGIGGALMSLIGIDLGTSAIKVVAYAADGSPLAEAREAVPGYRPSPGYWEVDVRESRAAFESTLRSVASSPAVRADPPVAVSFSSSAREVFPVSEDGTPLGRCLMTADTRGDDVAAITVARRSAEDWFRLTGHVPRRMDGVNRALWWRREQPEIVARTRWFMNWHEYYSLLLTGRAVVDACDAGTWATYDTATGCWSAERIAETGIEPSWLSEIERPGVPIGMVTPRAAAEYGLPANTLVVTGALDAYAASIGSGATDPGVVGLACGTWHSFVLPVATDYPVEIVHDGMNVFPHPGRTGLALLATNPNGMSVIDWARDLLHLSIADLDTGLGTCEQGPCYVTANPTFTPLPHVNASPGFGGSLGSLTLATTAVDIVRAIMEGIACEFSGTLESLRQRGVDSTLVRATGGGSKSTWWMQLTADVAGIPVEVVSQAEPGTLGAAMLAGVGAGVYADVPSAVDALVTVGRRYEPDLQRGGLYDGVRERLALG